MHDQEKNCCSSEQPGNEETRSNDTTTRLQECESQLNKVNASFLYLTAEFDNYKKRQVKDRAVWQYTIQAEMLHAILPIVDNLERALADYQRNPQANAGAWIKGVELTMQELTKLLDKYNVKPMNNYTTFNPEFHEAITTVKSERHKTGEIVEVLQKGYLLNGQVLRPARVSIAE